MKESTNDINEIIIRYLDGSAALEEKMLLLRWLKQSDGNRDDFAVTRDLWLSCNVAAGNELEVDIALEKLKDRILLEHFLRAWHYSGCDPRLLRRRDGQHHHAHTGRVHGDPVHAAHDHAGQYHEAHHVQPDHRHVHQRCAKHRAHCARPDAFGHAQ